MAEMTRRDQELQGLYELRKNKEALEKREKERKELYNKQADLNGDIKYETEKLCKWLPENNACEYERELRKKYRKKGKRVSISEKVFSFLGVILMGLLMCIILKNNESCAAEMNIVIWIFMCLGILLLAIISCSYEIPDFVWAITVITMAPAVLIVVPIYMLITQHIFLVAIPLAGMIVAVFLGRKTVTKEYKYDFTTKEKSILKEKQALDTNNRQINQQNEEATIRKVREKYKGRLNELDSQLSKCKSEIATLKTKVQSNGWLFGDDIQWMDQVIHYIQSRRADSIKEALRLVDMEQERARQRKLDEQRHKEIMEELEYQSWEAANARAEQREAAERAEKALRDSEAAAERARYEDEMRRYEAEQRIKQELLNLEIERNRR